MLDAVAADRDETLVRLLVTTWPASIASLAVLMGNTLGPINEYEDLKSVARGFAEAISCRRHQPHVTGLTREFKE